MVSLEMTEEFIEIRNLQYYRGPRMIFDRLSISIPQGKVVAIMGPSGSGKTTLLRLLSGQLKPDSGEIVVNGYHIPSLDRATLFEVRKTMGMLFQSGALFTDLTVFENVAFPLRIHTDLSDDMIRDLVLMKLQSVGLRGATQLMPNELSGGMARRVALARAIALDPAIIMYDEPFTGLDPIAMGVIVQLIRTLNEAFAMTTIVVSHNIQETADIADYIYVVSDGKVIGSGTPASLLDDPSPRVQQFLQGMPDGPVPFHYPAEDYREDLFKNGG
jgi:phospholipid/cholesterol/gamma-HCH transport system ATP-binding protein|tara:strand:+ start:4591 stop:5409 length:819 start_codon:yes stop_codon:yes gene_type:complete